MAFVVNPEREELRSTVRAFLEVKSPESEVRRLMETREGYDPAVWTQLGSQLGLPGITIPETFGGSGGSTLDAAVVFEEMGRALVCAPFLGTVALAVPLILASGDTVVQRELLASIAVGETIATAAVADGPVRWNDATPTDVSAEIRDDGAWRLTGLARHVVDGTIADAILVPAQTSAGLSVFVLEPSTTGVVRTPSSTMDLTRKQATVSLNEASARLLGTVGGGAAPLNATMMMAAVALAAEQVGGAQRTLDMAVAYAKERVQFGRRIGSFQAIKHKCAEMALRVESARSAAYFAAEALATGIGDPAIAASLAKSYCSEAYTYCAAENIQIHGGIGYTWEHPAHLYLKRAKSSELLFGQPSRHREMLAELLGVDAGVQPRYSLEPVAGP